MRRKGWWQVPVLLILAAALFVVLLVVEINDREDKQRRERIEEQASALEKQRDRLVAQRDQLQRDLREATAVTATEQLLFLELDERIYTQIYPKLQPAEIPGVLGLSPGNLPGDPGKLSREGFDELLAAGWGLCLVCEDGDAFAAWDEEITRLLAEAQIPKPDTVYFPEDRFSASLQEELVRCGYRVAVPFRRSLCAAGTGWRSTTGRTAWS